MDFFKSLFTAIGDNASWGIPATIAGAWGFKTLTKGVKSIEDIINLKDKAFGSFHRYPCLWCYTVPMVVMWALILKFAPTDGFIAFGIVTSGVALVAGIVHCVFIRKKKDKGKKGNG